MKNVVLFHKKSEWKSFYSLFHSILIYRLSYKIHKICKNCLYKTCACTNIQEAFMGAYKVDICGVNTSKLPILKEEEKELLFKRIKEGDLYSTLPWILYPG